MAGVRKVGLVLIEDLSVVVIVKHRKGLFLVLDIQKGVLKCLIEAVTW